MHSTAAVTIGGSPSTNVNINHNLYQPSQHQTQYGQVTQQHPHISSPTQQIQQPQSHLHHQHPNQNHHQLVFGPLPQTTYESATAPTANQHEQQQPHQTHHQQQPPAHQQQQPISVDTSSVISNHQALSPIHHQQQQPQHYGQQHQQHSHYNQQSLNHHHHHPQQHNTTINHNPSLDYNHHSQERQSNNYNQLPQHLQQSSQDGRQEQRHNRDNRYQSGHNPQNPGSIRWTAAGISTSAERRLPFVHRFRPVGQGGSGVGNQDSHNRAGNLDARHQHPQGAGNPHHSHNPNYNSHGPQSQDARLNGPGGHLGHRQNYHNYRRQDNFQDQNQRDLTQSEKEKRAKDKMAQYETNPVGSLQERFQSRGIPPNYKVVQTEGASHCPTFTFQVFIGDMMAVGVGNSKKQAKHAAARNMLDKLDGREPSQPTTPGQTVQGTGGPTGTIISTTGENGIPIKTEELMNEGVILDGQDNAGNTIGQLQEHCVRHGLPMPTYDLSCVGGQPHQRSFTINCRVGCLSISGEGTSKKDAKREAATKMWQRLKVLGNSALHLVTGSENGNGVVHSTESVTGVGAIVEVGDQGLDTEFVKMELDKMKIDTLTPKHSKAIQQFYKGLKGTKGSRLYELHSTSIKGKSSEFVKMLADLGQEQQFEVTYVDVDEKTDSDEVQCLVQLSTLPVAVCYGVGEDITSANNDAARNALNYLKMMTKTNPTVEDSSSTTKPVKNGEKSVSVSAEEVENEEVETDCVKKEDKGNKSSKKSKDQKNGK